MQRAEEKSLWARLEELPVSVYFILIILAMSYITLRPLGLPIPVTELTRDTYEQVDMLKEGDIMLIEQGYGAGTMAFHEPGLVVVMKHAISKGVKIVLVSGSSEAPLLFERALKKVKPEQFGYVYGKDYVHLGYYSGGEPAYAAILSDITSVFTADYQGTPIDQLDLMKELTAPTWQKISLIYVQTAGGEVIEGWIRQAAVRYDIPLITQVNSMMVPTVLPYWPVNCEGIMNGGIGAAEYESLSGYPGDAIKLSDMMTMGGMVVLVFLVLGNIGWFGKRMKKEG